MIGKPLTCILLLSLPIRAHSQDLSLEQMDKVKSAAVFIRVDYEVPVIDLKTSGSGSGFFINEYGYIATNYHVIQPLITLYSVSYPAPEVKITAIQHSGKKTHRSFDCKVMAVDKENDLAILKITDTTKTPFLPLNTGSDLIETATVWVFGYPFGDAFSVIQRGPEITVTKGGITALRHNDKDSLQSIQVDAVVNPGNSGGPCVNAVGEAIAIINMSGGQSNQNFGIPSHFLHSLMTKAKLPRILPETVNITVNTAPDGATVFCADDDSAALGNTGHIIAESGWRTFYAMKPGFEPTKLEFPVSADTNIRFSLQPLNPILLSGRMASDDTAMLNLSGFPQNGSVLMQETFENDEVFQGWEQSTGGQGTRSWFLEDNNLRQFDEDGMLHTIYLGDTSWSDYLVFTKMKIEGKEGDPRAGLIFRESDQGFYLFRIFQGSGKAQLAYHNKHPFGWTVLMEKALDSMDNGWHQIAVAAQGDRVGCFLDSVCIFYTNAPYSNSGRIGFYSVESSPHFDSLTVTGIGELTGNKPRGIKGVLSYWFTDYFSFDNGSWYQYKDTPDNPQPWFFGDAGCMQRHRDKHTYFSEFTRYRLRDYTMSIVLTLGAGEAESRFEFFFGKTQHQRFALRFLKQEKEVQLIQVADDVEKILRKKPLSGDFFGAVHGLRISIKDGNLGLNTDGKTLLEYSGKLLSDYEGSFGFSVRGAQLVLHQSQTNSAH